MTYNVSSGTLSLYTTTTTTTFAPHEEISLCQPFCLFIVQRTSDVGLYTNTEVTWADDEATGRLTKFERDGAGEYIRSDRCKHAKCKTDNKADSLQLQE